MLHRLLHRPWLIGIGLAALKFTAHHYGFREVLELRTLDARFQLRRPLPLRLPIVSIDRDSFDELNLPWPWPRTLT